MKDAYRMSSQEDVRKLYRVWAHSYDSGFSDGQGYQLPRAVAQAYLASGQSLMWALELGWSQNI